MRLWAALREGVIGHYDFVPMVSRISVEVAGMAAIIQSVVEADIGELAWNICS